MIAKATLQINGTVFILQYANQSIAIMKILTKTAVLLKAFDMELKAMLKRDLQNFRAIQNKKNNDNKQHLLAA